MVRGQSSLLWPADRMRTYANHLDSQFDLSEVELCFGQSFGPGGLTEPKIWVVTTPVHLLGFGRAITRTLVTYGERYGRVPDDDAGAG